MMLEVALKFEKAFIRYEEEYDKFLSYFLEKENGKKRIGPPTSIDWRSASVFVQFQSTFYEVTLKFSGTLHVTSNNFYHEVCEIHNVLTKLADADDPLLSAMAASMKEKYNKYWGNADNINPMLFLADLLDLRCKMRYLKYCFESLYNVETVAMITVKVESILQRLYAVYNVEVEGVMSSKQQHMGIIENKSDIDVFLAEEPVNPLMKKFDILLWWKDNASKYKTLSLISKDILVIPVSSVASESAFSTSGRILDPFRSSLSPKMVEALIKRAK
ncbi:zinc finger BED domain-containing protein RICESLEEPER 1-like [Apium graveolens]|uniref:zinc finger BED domain-containing protein RICESLEEPER 1-like n=1 Tax=Apium graveolens TaxID=4045 RepID=UPI003D7ABFA6